MYIQACKARLIPLSLEQATGHHLHVLSHRSRLVIKKPNKQQTVLIQIQNKMRRGIFRVNRLTAFLIRFELTRCHPYTLVTSLGMEP